MDFKYFLKLYEKERKYEFKARTFEEWEDWRVNFRRDLINILGDFPEKSDFDLKILEKKSFKDISIEKIKFNSSEDIEVIGYLLTPNIDFPAPFVIAMPGHGIGAKDAVFGSSFSYMKNFGLILAQNGFLTFVIEQLGFGERRERKDIEEREDKSSCRSYAFWALMQGKTLIGLRVWDVIRTIDLFLENFEIKKEAIGIYGISGGGTTALFASAIDDRIKATVISGYLNTFKDSILSINHCECNYIPKVLNYGEMYDIASLIAPRFLFIEHGKKDPIFPIESTVKACEKVRAVYEFLGVPENLDWEFFDGGHEIYANKSIAWLKKILQKA